MIRRLISIVALFGVLVHAYAVVRHSATMVRAALPDAVAALEADLGTSGAICHGNRPVADAAAPISDGEQDGLPERCPLCCGQAPVFVVVAADLGPALILRRSVETVAFWSGQDQRRETFLRLRPPSRGPPGAVA